MPGRRRTSAILTCSHHVGSPLPSNSRSLLPSNSTKSDEAVGLASFDYFVQRRAPKRPHLSLMPIPCAPSSRISSLPRPKGDSCLCFSRLNSTTELASRLGTIKHLVKGPVWKWSRDGWLRLLSSKSSHARHRPEERQRKARNGLSPELRPVTRGKRQKTRETWAAPIPSHANLAVSDPHAT